MMMLVELGEILAFMCLPFFVRTIRSFFPFGILSSPFFVFQFDNCVDHRIDLGKTIVGEVTEDQAITETGERGDTSVGLCSPLMIYSRMAIFSLMSFGSFAQAQAQKSPTVPKLPAVPSVSTPEDAVNVTVPSSAQQPAGAEASVGYYIPPLPIRAEPPPNYQPQPAPQLPTPIIRFEFPDRPIQIMVKTEWPALINGKITTVPVVRRYVVEAERVQALRLKGLSAQMEDDLKDFVQELRTPKDARFERMGVGWVVVQSNGIKVDYQKARQALDHALKSRGGTQINLDVIGQIAPKRTLNFFQGKGITAHLGTGITNYYGSSLARITNIHVGTRRFQDRLVTDSVVSFNKILGPISRRAGFVTGLVIAGDQTASGIGGGICQVSTTVFRTLYVAGLPVLQRRPHSYQVFYYKPQGLDAAIYQPSLDLKFKNTTGAPLWFQAEWDDEKHDLNIHVFGKRLPYRVNIVGPKILSETASPPDRFVKDPKLAKGQRKQIDWAAKGARIAVHRQFIKNGEVVSQETLYSQYRPWPNIFLIGTKEE